MENTRQQREVEHGVRILDKALKVWGHDSRAGRMRIQRRVDFMVSAGGIAPGKKLLEVGCGTGQFTRLLAETGADITAIDISPDLLDVARSQVKFPNVKFQVMDAESLPGLADGFIDLAVGNAVLHHMTLAKTLGSLYRVLKPGGKIIFSEPNMLNPQMAVQKNIPFIKRMMGDSPDETAFFKWRFRRDLAAAGFVEIAVEPYDFLHPMIPDFLAGVASPVAFFFEKVPLLREIAGSLSIAASKPLR